ncbi:MAG: dihydroorotate dehydrogenase electron transfer subunit [Desulfobulbaceae bacterium]
MTEFQEKAIITGREELASGVIRIALRSPRIAAEALPGQFVMTRVGDGLDPLLRRPFSIHHADNGETISLLFKVVGKGTRLLAGLRPGDTLDLLGPLGKGFSLDPDTPFCLIGGGMGIAPLFFLAAWFRREGRPTSQPVLLGAQTQAELLVLAEEFTELGYPVLTATDDGSLGHAGLVTDLLDEILKQVGLVYVCGPMPMMRTVAAKCRSAHIACQVSLETHMACGLGACLGCTVPAAGGGYIHVCREGPVLPAGEVAWTL